ncbi:MAG TPA: phosphonate ABC transporter ATP-binding protein [Spirochaetia bacterium]|nr:phosphonate ABC transporter ATP-binding protein [Spirochaetia bacterium]
MLEITNLTKVYDDGTRALEEVSFSVKEGEFLVVIGLSGSGKSTLLRCINRLIEPTSGKIMWDGEDVTAADSTALRKVRRRIGMIFQHFNLVRRSSVLTNVMAGRLGYVNTWPTLLHRFPREDRERAVHALKRVGLTEQSNKRASELSGGQQQRVGIARALMQEPSIILADEPVASLDPVLAHTILGYLEQLNRDEGMTIICSLHYLDLVQRYATQVIGLRAGRLVYQGSREDIRNMTDEQFKEIYGEEAVRVATGPLTGEQQKDGE